ncbi:hypothetical protein LuPra_02291 [Luteitalea pratensis]|uniref:Uncharacterized protein n=1 Tax=Luteitalea pratensis TaxID=1855912 RepID=A0A143PLL0_LUTPR|nr:hypothetical protein [Luteitalea pratensis]AMY09080.1 hypothetical protein LuPra_02291 [Luteitalea pratensis]
MTTRRLSIAHGVAAAFLLSGSTDITSACESPKSTMEATPSEVRAFFKGQGKMVLTFLGYSGAGYEDEAALFRHAAAVLDQYSPTTTIVNIGATPDGIGRVYELAKQRGFSTSGVVSTQARESNASVSPCVDHTFYVRDSSWGGVIEGTDQLSPTSAAMVDVSDRLVAIGGGEVARDELVAARLAGKDTTFIAADMNHRIAIEKAAKKGAAPPTDFRGAADAAFGRDARVKR